MLILVSLILSLSYVVREFMLCPLLRALKLTSSRRHNQSITDLTKQTHFMFTANSRSATEIRLGKYKKDSG